MNRFRLFFIKLGFILTKRKFLKVKSLNIASKNIELIEYSTKKKEDIAKYTAGGNIIVQDKLMKLDKYLRDFIILHEYGHKSQNMLWKLIFLPSILLMSIGAIFSVICLLMSFLFRLDSLLILIYSLIFCSLIFMILFFLEELCADYYALNSLGAKEIKGLMQISKKRRIRAILTLFFIYPPPEITIWAYNKWHKNKDTLAKSSKQTN